MQPQVRQPNPPSVPSHPAPITTAVGPVQAQPVMLSPTALQAFPDLKWAATPPAPVLYQSPATHSLEYLAYKKAKQAAAATLANGRMRSPDVSPVASSPRRATIDGPPQLNGTEGGEDGDNMDVDPAAPASASSGQIN